LVVPAGAVLDEPRLAVDRFRTSDGSEFVGAVRSSGAALEIVREAFLQHGVAQTRDNRAVDDRKQELHAAVQIARHQIRAADVNLFLSAVLKVVDTAVFQEAADHASDGDVVADARDAWSQAAEATHQQIYSHAGTRSFVEQTHHGTICERIHFENQTAFGTVFHFAANQFGDPAAQRHGRDKQFAEILLV